jgi:predicted HTH transcriptional regulator
MDMLFYGESGAKIPVLQDLGYVEQRGTGIRRMIAEMHQANLEPPHFKDAGTYFVVALKNHTLLDEKTLAWLNQFASYPLSDRQRLVLAYLRVNVQMTNADYQMSEEDKCLNRQFYGM